jgi:hypothetical protein
MQAATFAAAWGRFIDRAKACGRSMGFEEHFASRSEYIRKPMIISSLL